MLELSEIDSAGDSAHDVMELITDVDATLKTQEMLSDSFMQVRRARFPMLPRSTNATPKS
eukprot:6510780-Prymnesium_polylepis.1